jgi:division protein CdvB (Snf7/Vps24/ESCRT-III family)
LDRTEARTRELRSVLETAERHAAGSARQAAAEEQRLRELRDASVANAEQDLSERRRALDQV